MRRRRNSEDGGFNIWRSYSDMMAGVLLLFVLIMCVTLFQAQKNYDDTIKERDERIAMQQQYTAEITEQQNALNEKEDKLQDQDEKLRNQNEKLAQQQALLDDQAARLAEQEKTLNAQQQTLNDQQQTLAAQQQKLTEQETRLAAQQSDLDEKTNLLAAQQQKIDNIIGVKAEVVESLQSEFASNNVNVNIDSKTGAMTLDANVMFDYDDAELTDEGKAALRDVLPIYCRVLLNNQYRPYLAEIIIDGYTDTDGDYGYNLELSQQRSLAVAQYLLEIQGEFLNESETVDLQNYLTVNGHSMSNPVLDASGNVDMEASRRVEVKFRLKDEEMIQELNTIMGS